MIVGMPRMRPMDKPVVPPGYHSMPDGTSMKGSTHGGGSDTNRLEGMVNNYLRTSGYLADDQVKYGGQVGGLGSRTADLLVGQGGVPDSFPLRAGALVGDIALDPSWLIPGLGAAKGTAAVAKGANALKSIGVVGPNRFVMSVADNAGAQAARGVTEKDLMNSPAGLYAAILRNMARHRSRDPYLGLGVKPPGEAAIKNGNAAGPGTFFAKSQQASDHGYSTYGDNVYRIREPFSEVWNTVRNSPGYIQRGDLPPVAGGGTKIGPATSFNDPLIQDFIKQGYKGFQYADDAFVDWTVGAKPFVGLSKVSGPTIPETLIRNLKDEFPYSSAGKFLNNTIGNVRAGVDTAVDNVVKTPIKRVRDAKAATQEAYQKTLKEYGDAEAINKQQYLKSLPWNPITPNLPPPPAPSLGALKMGHPMPPGYLPTAPAPQAPGSLDFLQYLFSK